MTQKEKWWWVGYTDSTRPRGDQARGVVVIKHAGPEHLVAATIICNGLAPRNAKPLFGIIEEKWGDPPPGYANRLLGKDEAEALAKAWDPGHRGLASPEQIEGAFLDDDAKDGEPLFKPRGGK